MPELESAVDMQHNSEQQHDAHEPHGTLMRQDRVQEPLLQELCVMVVCLRPHEHLEVAIHMEEDKQYEDEACESHGHLKCHGRLPATLLS